MELRSFSVQQIYGKCVTDSKEDVLTVRDKMITLYKEDIKSMVNQLPKDKPLHLCHVREDGEQWTPFLQVVKMIVLLGEHIGMLEVERPITKTTIIKQIMK